MRSTAKALRCKKSVFKWIGERFVARDVVGEGD